jgi:uncharacterized protein
VPRWGLTRDQRETRPWGLTADSLAPDKTITDPVHGDIHLTRLERRLLDTPPMQHLRRVRQLGNAHLVYPGATHSRLSHALGSVRTAQELLDRVIGQRGGPDAVDDLFAEWAADASTYQLRIAEAVVLVRLAALLHDLGHVPFGHTLEDELGLLRPHAENVERFNLLWSQLDDGLRRDLGGELTAALRAVIVRGKESLRPEYAFAADLVADTISADLLDYVRRDHLFSGLPAQFGERFMSGFYVSGSNEPRYPRRLVMRVVRDRGLRADVLSELFKYLRFRYELSERVYAHHAKLAADAMVGKLAVAWLDVLEHEVGSVDRARARLEELLLRHGDEGLLEQAVACGLAGAAPGAELAELAAALLDRRLFKLVANSGGDVAAERLHDSFAAPAARRALEQQAAGAAGIDEWRLALWIPPPRMRFKEVELLVDDGNEIRPLQEFGWGQTQPLQELAERHRALWAVSVFVHAKLRDDRARIERAVTLLADGLGIELIPRGTE